MAFTKYTMRIQKKLIKSTVLICTVLLYTDDQ